MATQSITSSGIAAFAGIIVLIILVTFQVFMTVIVIRFLRWGRRAFQVYAQGWSDETRSSRVKGK